VTNGMYLVVVEARLLWS